MEIVRTLDDGDDYEDLKGTAKFANGICSISEFVLSPIGLCLLVIIAFLTTFICVAKYCC
jgi:hypothetical protein